jgi:hypothetical protein
MQFLLDYRFERKCAIGDMIVRSRRAGELFFDQVLLEMLNSEFEEKVKPSVQVVKEVIDRKWWEGFD